jgi:hypothetical protein
MNKKQKAMIVYSDDKTLESIKVEVYEKFYELIKIKVSSSLFCNVISEHPPELPLKTFSSVYLLIFSKILSFPLLELPIK